VSSWFGVKTTLDSDWHEHWLKAAVFVEMHDSKSKLGPITHIPHKAPNPRVHCRWSVAAGGHFAFREFLFAFNLRIDTC
jgi:hypothetical protein